MSEQVYSLNALASPDDPRDYQAESIFPPDLSLPKVFDPRLKLLAVRDQGVQGSCVAQATACLKEIQEKKNVGFEDYMSPQYVYNNRINQPAEGMYSRDSMKILYKKGIVPEEEYPYGVFESADQIPNNINLKALNYKASGYAFVNTIETMKAAIYRSGACIIMVPVYSNSKDMWRPTKVGDIAQGLHAMAVVGWNEFGFIVRNSWGVQWGNAGYTVFEYKDWGMHCEAWTLIDDESSKPDPKYSKWYWKTWRAVTNTWKNMGSMKYMLILMMVLSTVIAVVEHWEMVFVIPATLIGVTIFSWLKRLYLTKG